MEKDINKYEPIRKGGSHWVVKSNSHPEVAAWDNILLSREDFKQLGFLRTNGKCCVPGCEKDAVDAHHIMDRKLWGDGGYYLSNCAPLCAKHHLDAEKGVIKPCELIKHLSIRPDHLKRPDKIDWLTDEEYREVFVSGEIDKWGN
jgi:hypothetical protein